MGGSASSEAIINYAMDVTNENNTNILNESITNIVSTTIMSSVNSCSSNVAAIQSVTFKNLDIEGDLNVGVDQSSSVNVSFDCVASAEMASEVDNSLTNDIMNSLTTSFDTNLLADLLASSESTQETSGIPLGVSVSDALSKVTSDTDIKNIVNTNLENVIRTNVENNFTSEVMNEFKSSISNMQNVEFQEITVGGDANVVLTQETAMDIILKSTLMTTTANKTMTDIVNTLGTENVVDIATTAETTATAESSATSVNTGLDLMGLCGSYIAIICGCCICIVGIIIFIVIMGKLKGGSSGGGDDFNAGLADRLNAADGVEPLKELSSKLTGGRLNNGLLSKVLELGIQQDGGKLSSLGKTSYSNFASSFSLNDIIN